MFDGDGADKYQLGDGNDTYLATGASGGGDGNDVVDGGAGTDHYLVDEGIDDDVFINLDIAAHNEGGKTIDANRAFGLNISGTADATQTDTITLFENASTGGGDDVVYGSAAANVLRTGTGGDNIFGFGGNDTLAGGNGEDTLVGGAGGDNLWGGSQGDFSGDGDIDTFVVGTLGDSGITKASRDTIWDFEDGADIIDIDGVDGNVSAFGDQAFQFIGVNQAFTAGVAGQLRAVTTSTGWLIEGSNDADKAAEFAIAVYDPDHSITWSIDDFNGLGGVVIPVGTTATFAGELLTDRVFVINESADTGNTHAEINAAGGTSNFAGLTFDAAAGNAFDKGADTVTINGSNLSDDITGTGFNDTIFGGFGEDTLTGGGGADTLSGGADDDTYVYGSDAEAGENIVDGPTGMDIIRTTANVDLSALKFEGIEQIVIAAGTTAIFSAAGFNEVSLIINESADTGATHLEINGASGTNFSLYFTAFKTGDAFDNGQDTITFNGTAGDDTITATDFADTINGLAGDDTLSGGSSNDTLAGGAGNDTLSGYSGYDTFDFNVGDGEDIITDFDNDAEIYDRIDVTSFGAAFDSLTKIQAAATDDIGGNTTIDFGLGDTLTLVGVLKGNLHANDFIFFAD